MTLAYRCDSCGRTWREAGPLPVPEACPICDRERQPARHRPRRGRFRRATFRSPRAFYATDPRRALARERDFGLRWRNSSSEPPRRVAWVEATGELYLAASGDPGEGGGKVEVLAVVPERTRVERALAGWERVCGTKDSLRWLRRKASALTAPGAPRIA